MKKYFFLLLLIQISCVAFSQTSFQVRLDSSDYDISGTLWNVDAFRIIRCADGGYFIVGKTMDPMVYESAKLIKTDSLGVFEWCQVFGSYSCSGCGIAGIDMLSSVDSGVYLIITEVYFAPDENDRSEIIRLDKNTDDTPPLVIITGINLDFNRYLFERHFGFGLHQIRRNILGFHPVKNRRTYIGLQHIIDTAAVNDNLERIDGQNMIGGLLQELCRIRWRLVSCRGGPTSSDG